jgi:hypothetical protein
MNSANPSHNARFLGGVLVKGLLLFLALNLLFALLNPLPALGRLSVYNGLIPGRARLPFGEVPDKAYNLSLFSLEAMFASHEVNHPKTTDEYRILVVGDSSVWGTLLTPSQTLTGQINTGGYRSADGRTIRAYNLGYPTISLTKDLLVLSHLRQYQPDMIVWLVTLEAFPRTRQLTSPLLQHNPGEVRALINTEQLRLDPHDPALIDLSFWQRTIIGQRRALADIFRLQIYSVMWSATGIDQYYPKTYELRANDQPADATFQGLQPPHLSASDLSLDVLAAGMDMVPGVPVLLVNEPMFIGSGANSDIRYNFFYPRWAYEDYRQLLSNLALEKSWHYLDLWDTVPASEFTNSAIHLTPKGTTQLAGGIAQAIIVLTGMKR